MTKKTNYTKITAKIILITLITTVITAFVYGEYLKTNAILSLSKEDAKKTSQLIFESLYSAMAKGWNKEELNTIITRLNFVDKNMEVNVYRGESISKLFGEVNGDTQARKTIFGVRKAFMGEEHLDLLDNKTIKFYYPIKTKDECIKCHTNSEIGETVGVIHISYPVEDLKVSLSKMVNFFIIFIVLFSIILFIALFFEFDKYLFKPIKSFISNINTISKNSDITKRIELKDDDIEEINSMQTVFNDMLDSIEFQFYNDQLTLLPNRKRLLETLERNQFSILFILDIDSFQEINNLYSDSVGDKVLKELSELIKKSIKIECSLFKLHADEFALYCTNHYELEEIIALAHHLTTTIEKHTFNINEEQTIFINVTIGIAIGDMSLLQNADIALNIAKKRKLKYLIYNSSMNIEHEYEQNMKWTKKIRESIDFDKIEPFFQPIVNCKTKEIIKYEALMRMKDNNGEYISPIYFLDLAKKNKLYQELTKIMIKKAFKIFSKRDSDLSINLSLQDILSESIVTLIIEELKNYNIGNRVTFEILESEGIENFEQVLDFINEVKKYGCKISIDDFGTGYSNFEYLMKLKVDYIKIDASMIKDIDTNINSKMVTQTIVDFAKKMNIKTVGEFVHSKNVYETISEIGIDYAQGYYFGEPKPLT